MRYNQLHELKANAREIYKEYLHERSNAQFKVELSRLRKKWEEDLRANQQILLRQIDSQKHQQAAQCRGVNNIILISV